MIIHTDGGSYNNGRKNQKARICAVVDDTLLFEEKIGSYTNNEAEMLAIEKVFAWIWKQGITEEVIIYSDSRLAVNMLNNVWKGQTPHIIKHRNRIVANRPGNTTLRWIPRQHNKAGQVLEFGFIQRPSQTESEVNT